MTVMVIMIILLSLFGGQVGNRTLISSLQGSFPAVERQDLEAACGLAPRRVISPKLYPTAKFGTPEETRTLILSVQILNLLRMPFRHEGIEESVSGC
jgi:hypothetical protein